MTRTTYDRLQDRREWGRLQDECRIAADLQRDHPDMARSEALRLAYQFLQRVPQ